MLDARKATAQQIDYFAVIQDPAAVCLGRKKKTLYGPCGGFLHLSIDVNESTGNFLGTSADDGCESLKRTYFTTP